MPASGDCDGGAGNALYDDVTATVLGGTLGITNTNIDGCCWHNVFTSFAPFLDVLATANEPACTIAINTVPSVIGCFQCNIPGQMNLTPTPDLNPPNTNHTVTATFLSSAAPYAPIVGATITFTVISGPNAGANGNGVTNGSGQATFTYTGTGGVGLDVIQASGIDTAPNPDVLVTSNDALKFWDADCNANLIPDNCDMDCGAYSGACLANYPGCGTEDDLNTPPNGIPDSCDDCVTNADCSNGQFCDGTEGVQRRHLRAGNATGLRRRRRLHGGLVQRRARSVRPRRERRRLCQRSVLRRRRDLRRRERLIDGPNPNCNDGVGARSTAATRAPTRATTRRTTVRAATVSTATATRPATSWAAVSRACR